MALQLTVTTSGLTNGTAYNLYRYDDEKVVPSAIFNANAEASICVTEIQGTAATVHVITEDIMPDQKVIYRAVRADTP